MKIIHGDGYSDAEKREFITLIHSNLVTAMTAILRAMPTLGLELADSDLKVPVCLLSSTSLTQCFQVVAQEFLTISAGMKHDAPLDKIKRLWQDSGVQKAFDRRNEFQLSDSTP